MADNNIIRPRIARQIESIASNDENRSVTFSISDLGGEPLQLNEAEMVGIAEALSQNTHVEDVYFDWCLIGSSATAAAVSSFLVRILGNHPSITRISLTNNNINSNLAEVIGLALKTNTSLKRLDLDENEIGPYGADALAEGLQQNKTLQSFDLNENKIGDHGATALAPALRINKTLKVLHLGSNEITSDGGKALASALEKSSLETFSLYNNYLQDEGGKAIAQSLCENKSLTDLSLWETDIGDETCKALAAALCCNSSLSNLDIEDNERMTSAGGTAIANSLEHLNYAVEEIQLHADVQVVDRIYEFCRRNGQLNAYFQRVNQNIPSIPLAAWPIIFEAVECKPDLLFALLKTKPDVCRELQRTSRKRRRPDWLTF